MNRPGSDRGSPGVPWFARLPGCAEGTGKPRRLGAGPSRSRTPRRWRRPRWPRRARRSVAHQAARSGAAGARRPTANRDACHRPPWLLGLAVSSRPVTGFAGHALGNVDLLVLRLSRHRGILDFRGSTYYAGRGFAAQVYSCLVCSTILRSVATACRSHHGCSADVACIKGMPKGTLIVAFSEEKANRGM